MVSRVYIYSFFLGWLFLYTEVNAQTIIGMGTENPNPNAVLDLVSKDHNQGFLVPRLTTPQRTASGFTDKLTAQDNGLLVFDTDEGKLYFWYNGSWQVGGGAGNSGSSAPVWYISENTPDPSQAEERDFYIHQPSGDLYRKQDGAFVIVGNLKKSKIQYSAGTGITITDQNEIVNTGDLDPANELQDLRLSGTVLGLSGSDSTVDLSMLQDGTGTDHQQLSGSKSGDEVSISIDNGNSIMFSVADSDNDSTNELQSLSSVLQQDNDADGHLIRNLALPSQPQDAATKAYADSLHIADADQSSSNELQDLNLSGNILKITNHASATSIDLSPYLDDTDEQTLSISGNSLSIANGNTVDLSGVNTDAQDLTLTGNSLSLSGDASSVSLSAITPSDGQALKWNAAQSRWEAQSDTDTQYSAGTGISIDGSNQIINTAPDQTLSLTGSGAVSISGTYPAFTIAATDQVDDADANPTNELQDLQLNSHELKITNNASATAIDLSSYLDNTDAQSLTLTGNNLAISGGNSVSLSSINTDEQTLSLSSNNLSIAGGNSVSLSSYLDNTDAQTLALSGSSLSITAGNSVNLSSINTDSQSLSLSGDNLSISGGNSVSLAPYLDNTDEQSLSSSKTTNDVSISITGGNTTTFSVADSDNDAANEKITSASLVAGDILRIQEAGTDHDIDLSGFQKKALPASQVLVGNASGEATPMSLSGDVTLNSDGTMTITLDAVTTAKIIDQAITTAKLADDAVSKEKINADVAGNGLGQNADGSLEVNVGAGLQLTADQLQLANTADGQVLIGDGTQANSRTISGDVSLGNTGAATVTGLQGRSVSTTTPTTKDVLTWDGSTWTPQAFTSNGWYSGSTVPNATTPSGAIDGNYYYHTGTQTVYRKESGAWVELGKWAKQSNSTVKGATITSTRTPKIYIGTGSPSNGATNNAEPGDLYFDTSDTPDGRLWIKEDADDWKAF